MKRYVTALILLLALTADAAGEGVVPPYHAEYDFYPSSPGALRYGLYGYVNPAMLAYVESDEMLFFVADRENEWEDIDRFGGFWAFRPHALLRLFPITSFRLNWSIGFVHHNEPFGSVTDYRYAFGGGTRRLGFGLAYSHSSGDDEAFGREDMTTAGVLVRPNRYLSIGGAAVFTGLDDAAAQGILDLGIRPFGDEKLTLFGDFALRDDEAVDDAHWSAGFVAEVLPGIRLTARYFDTEAFTVGFNLSLGRIGLFTQSHFDDEQKYAYNSYGVRLFGSDRSIIRDLLTRDRTYVKLDLKGRVKYQRYRLFDDSNTLRGLLDVVDRAKRDCRVRGLAINTSGMRMAREHAWELREALRDFRAAGKRIVMYVDRAMIDEYHFASVADRIVLDPQGQIVLQGHMIGRSYIKGTMDKLGIGFDELRFFTYKSAYERYSRESMSEADREQRAALNRENHRVAREEICEARGIDLDEFDRLMNDEWIFMASEAVGRGLADSLGRWDTVEKVLEELEGGKKGVKEPEMLYVDRPPRDNRWGEIPRIAVIYALGICDMDEGIKARKLVKDVERATEDPLVKAVVFRVDSPGGDGLASDIVAGALRKCTEKKPVIVSQGAVAASGGYWLSMYGDTIVAAPQTITGSIGVIGGWAFDSGLYEKTGVTTDHVRIGEHADLEFGFDYPLIGRIPARPLTPGERSIIERLIRKSYEKFVGMVAVGRKSDSGSIEPIAQGRVWSGTDGLERGLVDVIGGLDTAVGIAREAAGIAPGEEVDIVEMPAPELFNLAELLGLGRGGLPFSAKEDPGARMLPGEERCADDDILRYLRFRIEHNGEPLYILPIEDMEMLLY